MNDKFQELYGHLKSNNLTDLDAQAFHSKYSNPEKAKEIYSYIKSQDMTDLDEGSFYSSYFGGEVKKKEDTTSNSEASTSDTSKKVTPEPSVSSGEGDMFTGYPGKEGNKYRYDGSNWYEYSYTDASDKGNVDVFNTPITNPSRVSALNKYFKKEASTSEFEKIFTGYPGKESNEYKVVDGTWQRREPKKEWQTIIPIMPF